MVLLIGLTVLGTTGIVMYGSTLMNDIESYGERKNVEHSMTLFDSKAAKVAVGESPSQQVTMPTGSDANFEAENESGWIRITVINESNGNVERVELNESLGKVVHGNDDAETAYQGGGVWRKSDNGSVMISPPEFHFRGQTLTLPVITVESNESLDDRVVVESARPTQRLYPDPDDDHTNPIAGDKKVNITIHSEYYQAWADFFRTRAGGVVTVDHANQTATLVLVTEPPERAGNIEAGVVSTGGSGTTITVDNGAFLASYNSSNNSGKFAGKKNEGRVVTSGEIKLQSDAEIRGSVVSGGTVNLPGDMSEIEGDVECTDGNSDCVGTEDGDIKGDVKNTNKKVPEPEPVGEFVRTKIEEVRASNDNDQAADINGNELVDDDTRELQSGTYYLEDLDESNDLILNVSDGDIVLGVDGSFDLDSDATICIVYEDQDSDNNARIFLADGGSNSEIDISSEADVITKPEQKKHKCDKAEKDSGNNFGTVEANKLWIYSPPGLDADFGQQVDFTGVIYAPDNDEKVGSVSLSGGRIYGAVVAHVDDMDENNRESAIYFDRALREQTDGSLGGAEPVRISYLHVTVNRLNVTA